MNIQEMQKRHDKLVEMAQGLLETREEAGEEVSHADEAKFKKYMEEAAQLREQIDNTPEPRLMSWEQTWGKPDDTSDEPADTRWLDNGAPAVVRWREGGQGAKESADVSVWRAMRARVTGPRCAAEERALSESVSASGGILVGRAWSDEVVDAARQESILGKIGARFVKPGDDSKLSFATVESDPIISYLAESTTGGITDCSFGSKVLNYKTHRGIVRVSRELMADANNLEQTLRRTIAGAFATALDSAVFYGASTGGEPGGVLRYSSTSISRIALGTTGAGGARFTSYAPFVAGWRTLAEANARLNRVGVAMSPRSYAQLVQVASTGDSHLLAMPGPVGGFNFQVTNAIPNTIAYGASTGDCSSVLMGDYRDLAIGMRLDPTVEILTERFASNYQLGILCASRYDHVVLRNGSFVQLEGAST